MCIAHITSIFDNLFSSLQIIYKILLLKSNHGIKKNCDFLILLEPLRMVLGEENFLNVY